MVGSRKLPKCPSKLYCGKQDKKPDSTYERVGNKDECFKRGMGVGMGIELENIKKKLEKKGIIMVTKKKKRCIERNGKIRIY